MNLTIRKATENDRDAIAQVYAEAFWCDWKRLHKDVNVVSRALADGLNIDYYYVAEKEKEVVGFIAGVEKENRAFSVALKSFKKHFGFFKGHIMGMALKEEFETSLNLPDNTVYIDVLGVGRDEQGTGVGTQLIQYLISELGKKRFTLTVTNINEHAIRCYKKNGFVEYDRKAVKYAKQKGFSEMIYMKLESQ